MNEKEIWSVLHMGLGGVALGEAGDLDAGDSRMMLGLFAHDDESDAVADSDSLDVPILSRRSRARRHRTR